MYIIVRCTCALILIGDMPTEPMIEISVTDRRGGRSQTAAAATTAMIDEHIDADAENEDDSDEDECYPDKGEAPSYYRLVVLSADKLHHRCFTHTLQLCVQDGFKIINTQHSAYQRVLPKVTSTVKHLRSSTHCSDTLEDCIRPQTACQTRY